MKPTLREVAAAPLLDEKKPAAMSGLGWGYIFALVGTVLFSTKAILIKLAYLPTAHLSANELDAITIMALRLGFSAPVYLAIFFWLRHRRILQGVPAPKPRDILLAALLGVLGYYICAWLDIQGLKYITAQLERLLLFTYPVFVFIFGAIFFGKPLSKSAIMAIALAYAGIGLIFTSGNIAIGINVTLGTAMVLSCAAAFAMFQLWAKPMIARLGSPLFTCCAMLGAGAAIFIHFIGENVAAGQMAQTVNLPPRIWMLGLALAFFSTLLPSFMINIAIGRIGPQATATMGMISPIATIILAIWWLGEPFGAMDALGTLLTLIGIGLYTWLHRRTKSRLPTSPPARDK